MIVESVVQKVRNLKENKMKKKERKKKQKQKTPPKNTKLTSSYINNTTLKNMMEFITYLSMHSHVIQSISMITTIPSSCFVRIPVIILNN
jgi:endoglucanase Acf2